MKLNKLRLKADDPTALGSVQHPVVTQCRLLTQLDGIEQSQIQRVLGNHVGLQRCDCLKEKDTKPILNQMCNIFCALQKKRKAIDYLTRLKQRLRLYSILESL